MVHDYKALGFRCGIEIHQQLDGRKLFCDCPAEIRKDKPDFELYRKLRISAGESGKVDRAALHEKGKDKYFMYQGYYDTTCLVEIDEEPPHQINQEALTAALQTAKLLNAEIVDEIQFMRKVVIDGSNTSGFQRTALVGRKGFVEINGRKIIIDTICLEEEACQVIERHEDHDVYNLSRLGIPLIEIATDASISSPEECKDVAEKIGLILRSTGKCKRGIGTIRQDVNISIKGGARTEIKGFQDLKSIPKVINNEIDRQLALIKKGAKVEDEVRNAKPDFSTEFLRPMPGADRMYPETDVEIIIPAGVDIGGVELLTEKAEKIEKLGIDKEIAKKLVRNNKAELFNNIISECRNVKPSFVADILLSYSNNVNIADKHADASLIKDEDILGILRKLDNGKISKDSVMPLLVEISLGKKPDFSKHEQLSDKELEKEIKFIIESKKGLSYGAIMGEVMAKFKGKADGKKIAELVKKNI
ncbi:MAG: Glu-tRNA(Gln) amidotransferase subunit GatE [Candidatus Woesearchaeota archaeon]